MNKKKLLPLLALLAVVLYLTLRNRPESETNQTETKAETQSPETIGEAEIVILSVNDMHASIDQLSLIHI